MDKLTPEQQQLLTDALQQNVETVEQLEQALRATGEAGADLYAKIESGLQKSLGAQLQVATEAEKLLEVAQNHLEVEQKRLVVAHDYANAQKKLQDYEKRIKQLRIDMSKTSGQERKNLEAQLKAQELTAEVLQKNVASLRAENELTEETTASIMARVEAAKKEALARAKVVAQEKKQQELTDDISYNTENMMQQMFGIKDTAGGIVDSLIDAQGNFVGMEVAVEGISNGLKKTFTTANMIKTTFMAMKDAAEDFKKETLGAAAPLTSLEETAKALTRQTGALQKYGKELRAIKYAADETFLTQGELADSYQTLVEGSRMFMQILPAQREELTEFSGAMARLGVDVSTLSTTFDKLSLVLGETPKDVKQTTNEMQKFARALGVGPNKMLADLNQNFDILARYGKEKGTEVFKELAVTAHKAGLEMSELVQIGEKFDTFEGAAEAAMGLNVALGGPLLNSMELHNATISERLQLINEAMQQSGKSFDQMNQYEKKLIANQLTGGDIAKAQALLNKENLKDIKGATSAYEDQAAALDDAAAAAEKTQQLKDRDIKIEEARIAAYEALAGAFLWVQETIKGVQEFMAPLNAAFNIMSGGLFGLGGAIMAVVGGFFAFKAATTGAAIVALKFVAIPLAIAAALALLVVYWDDIVRVATDFWNILVKIAKAFANFTASTLGVVVDFVFGGVSPDVSPDGSSAEALGGITGLATGTDSVSQSGVYRVGEKGEEIVALPQAASVINNENVQKMKQGGMMTSPAATSSPSVAATNTQMDSYAAATPGARDPQTINITLKLDDDILARHTVKVTKETLREEFDLG